MNRTDKIKKNLVDGIYEGNVYTNISDDIDYLLNEVERLKGALEKIRDWGDDRPDCYPLYNIAEEVLKDA